MTHYEERLEEDVAELDRRVSAVARKVEGALRDAVYALLNGDEALAYRVILGDQEVNRSVEEIDHRCHAFVARHLPSASHLRRISSVLRLDVELERIGDYAVAIARAAVQLSEPPAANVARDIDRMADQAREVLHKAIKSFLRGDAEQARAAKESAYAIERAYERLRTDLIAEGETGSRPLPELFALVEVFQRLERVLDQTENICEDTLFAVTGETKAPKFYRVLFVDERNDCASQIAEAIGRKAFPGSGRYESAGWSPAEGIDPALLEFMAGKGHSLDRAVASSLVSTAHELNDYDVIVSLGGDVRDHVPVPPSHTVYLCWDVGACPDTLEEAEDELNEVYKQLAGEIEDLIVLLRGEDAD